MNNLDRMQKSRTDAGLPKREAQRNLSQGINTLESVPEERDPPAGIHRSQTAVDYRNGGLSDLSRPQRDASIEPISFHKSDHSDKEIGDDDYSDDYERSRSPPRRAKTLQDYKEEHENAENERYRNNLNSMGDR